MRRTIKDVQEFVKDKGICLSTEYKNNYSYLTFKCNKCGVIFKTLFKSILKGHWYDDWSLY